MTEKYSLLPAQSYPLTLAQTALQWLSEKHPDFEIQPVNTIRPPKIEYTQTPQAFMPTDTLLSIIRKRMSQGHGALLSCLCKGGAGINWKAFCQFSQICNKELNSVTLYSLGINHWIYYSATKPYPEEQI